MLFSSSLRQGHWLKNLLLKPVFLCLSKHLSLFLNHAIIDRYYVYNIHKYAFLGLHYLMSAHKLLFLAHLIVGYMPCHILLYSCCYTDQKLIIFVIQWEFGALWKLWLDSKNTLMMIKHIKLFSQTETQTEKYLYVLFKWMSLIVPWIDFLG